MTSQPPARFENYPTPDETSPSAPFPDTDPVDRPAITPYYPPPTPPPGGTGRRGMLTVLAGFGVGAVVLVAIARAGSSSPQYYDGTDPSGGASEGTDPYPYDPDTEDPAPEPTTLDVGDYSASLPSGWTLDSEVGNEAIASRGDNRLLAWNFTVNESDTAVDLVSTLVRNRRGSFKGVLSAPFDESDADVQRVKVTASGKVGSKPATLTGQLWIDSDLNALLVVTTLVAKAGTAIADQADAMVAELSGNF